MGNETVLGNARIVLADRVIERGWVAFADGRIAEIGEGNAPAGTQDVGGDLALCLRGRFGKFAQHILFFVLCQHCVEQCHVVSFGTEQTGRIQCSQRRIRLHRCV